MAASAVRVWAFAFSRDMILLSFIAVERVLVNSLSPEESSFDLSPTTPFPLFFAPFNLPFVRWCGLNAICHLTFGIYHSIMVHDNYSHDR